MNGDLEKHPDAATLSLYYDGEGPPEFKAALVEHVDGCAKCRQELERLARLTAELRELPEKAAPSSLMERVRRGIAATSPSGLDPIADLPPRAEPIGTLDPLDAQRAVVMQVPRRYGAVAALFVVVALLGLWTWWKEFTPPEEHARTDGKDGFMARDSMSHEKDSTGVFGEWARGRAPGSEPDLGVEATNPMIEDIKFGASSKSSDLAPQESDAPESFPLRITPALPEGSRPKRGAPSPPEVPTSNSSQADGAAAPAVGATAARNGLGLDTTAPRQLEEEKTRAASGQFSEDESRGGPAKQFRKDVESKGLADAESVEGPESPATFSYLADASTPPTGPGLYLVVEAPPGVEIDATIQRHFSLLVQQHVAAQRDTGSSVDGSDGSLSGDASRRGAGSALTFLEAWPGERLASARKGPTPGLDVMIDPSRLPAVLAAAEQLFRFARSRGQDDEAPLQPQALDRLIDPPSGRPGTGNEAAGVDEKGTRPPEVSRESETTPAGDTSPGDRRVRVRILVVERRP